MAACPLPGSPQRNSTAPLAVAKARIWTVNFRKDFVKWNEIRLQIIWKIWKSQRAFGIWTDWDRHHLTYMWLHDDKIGYDNTYKWTHAHQDAWSDDDYILCDRSLQMSHSFDQSRFSASDGLVLTQISYRRMQCYWFLMISVVSACVRAVQTKHATKPQSCFTLCVECLERGRWHLCCPKTNSWRFGSSGGRSKIGTLCEWSKFQWKAKSWPSMSSWNLSTRSIHIWFLKEPLPYLTIAMLLRDDVEHVNPVLRLQ